MSRKPKARGAASGAGASSMRGPNDEELCAAARADLLWFVHSMFDVLHPGQKLVFAPYLSVLAELLMSAAAGLERRVIINMPPRHLKSIMVSVMYVAWRLGRDPTAKFICVSYGDDLAHDLSVQTRKVMRSKRYQKIFPGTKLEKSAMDHISTTKGGQRYATSVGSDITGFGGDEIILDDLMQPNDAASEGVKAKIREWVSGSVLTRFDDPTKGVLMLVMQRLASDDISATLEATEQYFVLRLPLVAEKYECVNVEGLVLMERHPGDVLNPDRFPPSEVDAYRRSLPKHVFDAQFQQRPSLGGSGMLSIEHFRRFDLQRMDAFHAVIHSWDIGATISGNPTVCTKWGVLLQDGAPAEVYLVGVIRLRLELPEVKAVIMAEDRRDRPELIVLDERGLGLGLYQNLQREGLSHVTSASDTTQPLEREGSVGLRPSMSKIDRFGRAVMEIVDGRVHVPFAAPWLEVFLAEVAAFPNIADDDQVDSMTQVVGNLDRCIYLAKPRV